MKRVIATVLATMLVSQTIAQQSRWWTARHTHVAGEYVCVDHLANDDPSISSPAALYESSKARGDTTARIEDKGDEIDVWYTLEGSYLFARFFRTLQACQALVQTDNDAAAAERRALDKYR